MVWEMDGLRECAVVLEDDVDGLGVRMESAIDGLDPGIALISGFEAELSEFGGEGGVGVSETVDEADFVGGVAMVGEEVDVACEC